MFTSPKTSLLGAATILFAVFGLFTGHMTYEAALPLITGGIGLIFSKDHNVSTTKEG